MLFFTAALQSDCSGYASDTHPGNVESFPYLREGTLLKVVSDIVGTLQNMLFGILLLSTKVFLTKNVTIKNHLLVLYETMH